MPRGKVIKGKGYVWENNFEQYRHDLKAGQKRAVVATAKDTVKILQTTVDRDSGAYAGSIYHDDPRQTKRGWVIAVKHPARTFYGYFLEKGTLGRRRQKLKQPSKRTKATTRTVTNVKRTKGGGFAVSTKTVKVGIKPRNDFKKALKAVSLVNHLEREMP
jgi:hypothetical protein